VKLNKIPKRTESEEQQYTRAVRKRIVQEDKEKEWEEEVKSFLIKTNNKDADE
jgi:hypothetical protein